MGAYSLITPRPYQLDAERDIYAAWNSGARNALLVLPTGGGKTVTFSDIIRKHKGACCAIAHRQELVSQISLALSRDGIRHRIIGPHSVIKLCVNLHMAELNTSFYDPGASCAVAGIDTLIRRGPQLGAWLEQVTLWVMDEAHPMTGGNKWGQGAAMFPNAKGLGVTATPMRADGKGVGRHADGVMDTLILGPSMRQLINMGYLTDYRIFAPNSNIDLSQVTISQATGDYNPQKLKTAVRKSHIVGDVVSHYLRISHGKLGVTFATDVETATDIAAQFNAAGVPAAVVSAETPDAERIATIRKFKNRQLLQLVNVDLFGEGFDLPGIEVVSMARPTKSYGLYVQQFGRGLRIMVDQSGWDKLTDAERRARIAASAKPHAIIIDHVNNVDPTRGGHGLPDAPRRWTLDRRGKRASNAEPDGIPVRACPNCTAVYERINILCPYCGFKPIPSQRSGPDFVDGDLTELDPATLAALRGEISALDTPLEQYRAMLAARHVPLIGQMANVKRHAADQEAQRVLRDKIALWAGYQRYLGRCDAESYRRFYFKFGIDVLSAQALKSQDAGILAERIGIE